MTCPYNQKTDNLEQGLLYKSNKNKLKNKHDSHHNLFEKISSHFNTSTEEFVGSATQIPLDRPLEGRSGSNISETTESSPQLKLDLNISKKNESTGELKKLEDQFNILLSEYTQQYKLMTDELLHNNSQDVLEKYANNNIKINNNYYYVNSYGFASKYDQDAWKNRSVSCSKEPVEISSDDFKKLLNGPPMGKGQGCNVAGFNIRGEDGWTGWVDVKGVAHHYPNPEVWNNRNESCTMNAISLTNDEVNGMPKGDDMAQNTFCERLNVDPKILQNLANLNSKLMKLGDQIKNETNKLSSTDKQLNEQLEVSKKNLENTLNKLKNNQSMTDEFSNDTYFGNGNANVNRTLEASARHSQIVLKMMHTKYLIGFFALVVLVIISFTTFDSNRVSTTSIIVLIIAIIYILYKFFNYFKNSV